MFALPALSAPPPYAQQGGASITQIATGPCGVNVANFVGNLTIICNGFSPELMLRMNAKLRRQSLSAAAAIREADKWREAYKSLESKLNELSPEGDRAKEARRLLQNGEIDKATAVLQQIADSSKTGSVLSEAAKQRIASEEYSLALAIELQSQSADALPHLERAYRLQPERWQYGEAYANALLDERKWVEAEPVLLAALRTAENDRAVDLRERAAAWNSLALLYSNTGRIGPAERSFRQALQLYQGAASNRPGEAEVLNNLAVLYQRAARIPEAESAFKDALAIFRSLAEHQPSLFDPYLLQTLQNLGGLYSDNHRYLLAERYDGEALERCRQLATGNPAAYNQTLAQALANLSEVYRNTGRAQQAEQTNTAAQSLFEELAKSDPVTYQPLLLTLLSNELLLYIDTRQYTKAEQTSAQALASARGLVEKNPAVYDPVLATILQRTGMLYSATQRYEKADEAFREAIETLRVYAAASPALAPELARAKVSQANFFRATQQMEKAAVGYQEAIKIYDRIAIEDADAFAFERASADYNLAEVYQRIPKLDQAEDPYQRALAVFRLMAAEDRATYQPYVVRTLCGLALLHHKVGHGPKSKEEMGEALRLSREDMARGYPDAANGLAKTLVYAAMLSNWGGEQCPFAKEAARLSQDPEVTSTTQQILAGCEP